MTSSLVTRRKYADADGYDAYMGDWSAGLSPLFLDFVEVEGAARVLDIGCGTGNLLAAIPARCPGAQLLGVDPSPFLLAKAKDRVDLEGATLLVGYVEQLPLTSGVVDYCLSMLVLQEFADRTTALGEMRRVTRAGGVVAACQWDFARMPVIAALVEAIEQVNPAAGRQILASSPAVFADEAELLLHWEWAGFESIETGRIAVSRTFHTFEHLWSPLAAGSTPSTLTLASLPPADQGAVRALLQRRFEAGAADGPLQITAEALVVRGNVTRRWQEQ